MPAKVKKPATKSTKSKTKKKSVKASSYEDLAEEEVVIPPKPRTAQEEDEEEFRRRFAEVKKNAAEGLADPPDYLGKWGTLEWYELGSALYDKNLFNGPLDYSYFAKYCYQHDTYIEVCRAIKREGKMLFDPTGVTGYAEPNPKLRLAEVLLGNLTKMSNQFGITPGSRDKMKIREREESNKLKAELGVKAPNTVVETRGRKPTGF